jgi:hypothetical protein
MKLLSLNVVVGMGLAALIAGCTKAPKADTPEGALEKYVTAAFDAKSPGDRQKLIDLSAGDALVFIERMSDEEFKKHFIDSKLRFVSMKAKDRREENTGDVSLVYELEYKEGDLANPTIHTNKKIAYLTHDKETNEWKIKATKNLKSFIERKEDLVVPPLSELPPETPETTNK